jgi:thiol-disulfide isomerase/thioredoxin
MRTSVNAWLQFGVFLLVGGCLPGMVGNVPLRAAQSTATPAAKADAAPHSSDAEEQNILNEAFQSANGNPQLIIKNMSAFLDRFPQSTRREVVLRTICDYAATSNSPAIVVQYGQMLLKLTPEDPKLLNLMVEALARQDDRTSQLLGVDYTTRLIKIGEADRDRAALSANKDEAAEPWTERIADVYAKRGAFHRELGDNDSAMSDYAKSYATFAKSSVAEILGDIALSQGDSAKALDYYVTAFAFPDRGVDPSLREEVRRKLGSLYVAQHHSENGLGDLVLSRYDDLMPQLSQRLSAGTQQNAGVEDPFKFVLERLDGSLLPMSGYQGKVLVLDFWATWCGPCRIQGPLVDQVAANFRAEPGLAFLSVNMDQDRSAVPAFLNQARWTVPTAYGQGLEQLLNVRELPTLVIFNRTGQIIFREDGLDPQTFADDLTKRLQATLHGAPLSKP